MEIIQADRPVVISFVSGKGGVGKTMLAVAVANELSHARPTLLLDLDFFNRGLSGMFVQEDKKESVDPPAFIRRSSKDEWRVKRISETLFTVSFPDITNFEISPFDQAGLDELAQALDSWIGYLCSTLGCEAVVLDCHGGPDALSFAAVKISNKSLLISEPDRVTMYGTLHFLRILEHLEIDEKEVHLVFNKIGSNIGGNFLWKLYDEFLAARFSHNRLLAAFPMELHLAKSVKGSRLVTKDYPRSMLAQKTQVMIADLFEINGNKLVSQRAKDIPRWMAYFIRRFFGRTPKLLNVNFLTALGFSLLLLVVGANMIHDEFVDEKRELRQQLNGKQCDNNDIELCEELRQVDSKLEHAEKAADYLLMVGVLWSAFAAAALVLSWTTYLDREGTVFLRRRKVAAAICHLGVQVLLWAVTVAFISTISYGVIGNMQVADAQETFFTVILCGLCLLVCGIWTGQAYVGYWEIKHSNSRVAGFGRIAFAAAVLCGLFLAGLGGL